MFNFLHNMRQRAERHREKVRQHTDRDRIILETNDLVDFIVKESNRLSTTVPQVPLPSRAVTSLDGHQVSTIFGLTETGPRDEEFEVTEHDKISFPPCLNTVLSDYQLAMGRTTTTEVSARTRIDAILLLSLAQMKKEAAANPRSSIASVSSTRSLHIQHERYILMPWQFTDGLYMIRGKVDWSIWYENPDCLETNCVLLEAKTNQGTFQCLAYMAMVYWTRRTAGLEDLSVWGIVTDSHTWEFIHIRADGTYTSNIYNYNYSSDQVLWMLSKLYRGAARTAETPTRNKRWTDASNTTFANYDTTLQEIAAEDDTALPGTAAEQTVSE